MSNIQRIHLGPETSPLQQGRSTHGRWRVAYQQAEARPDDGPPMPVVLDAVQDSERLAFAIAEGPAAEKLAYEICEYLWTRDTSNGDWPLNLREWLSDTARWTGAPPGRTGFICGRLDRNVAGGRIYLAWLGMSGVRLLDRSTGAVTLDTIIGGDEGWTAAHGPEPVGMALHAYRGSLFSLDRLAIFSAGAAPLGDDLAELSASDLQLALEDWSAEADHDLVVFDLRLNQVLSRPNTVVVNYRWVAPDLCLLTWHPSPNVTGYRVEESTAATFDDTTLVAELTDGRQVQYRFSPPTSVTRYYRVTPLNQSVPGTPSDPVCPTPMMLPTPILEPIQWASDGGYYLHWTTILQATGYEVQRSSDIDFDTNESEVVYRGELSEVFLPPDALLNQFYRVRAINVLYAPNTPSNWSQPLRAPARLDTPTFTRVTQKRIEWSPVAGARQYMVRVAALGQDEEQGEEVAVTEPACGVADQPALYRVRALRRPNDLRTVSEWSDSVTISPAKLEDTRRRDMRPLLPVLVGAAIVALLVGVGLGLGVLRAYQEANATSTRVPLAASDVQATSVAATFSAFNATQVNRLETAVKLTSVSFRDQTATATLWTATPTPSNTPNLTETIEIAFHAGQTATAARFTSTPTPSNTPNLTKTIDAAFRAGETATAAGWTATPTPSNTPNLTETIDAAFQAGQTATAAGWTATPTPTETPNITATFDAMFQAQMTASAAGWTDTPTPSNTPNITATFDAMFQAGQTATAAGWTATPTPSNTPNITATFDAMIQQQMTASAAGWTATPTPSETPVPAGASEATATAEAMIIGHLAAGCYVINLPGAPLPVYSGPLAVDPPLVQRVPLLAKVTFRLALKDAAAGQTVIWLRVEFAQNGSAVLGWIQVPEGTAESQIYSGHDCPLGK